jgi:hypothetical protein
MTWKCIHKSHIFVAGGGVKCVHNGLLYSDSLGIYKNGNGYL